MEEIILEVANYLEIKYACQDALVNHKMIGIIGRQGLGKTVAINAFKKSFEDNVTIVTVTESMSAKIFYSCILNIFDEKRFKTTEQLYFIIQSAIQSFRNNSENKLLIIDEASLLSPQMIRYLREFRDGTIENTGIILLGVNSLRSNMEKWKNSDVVGIPEFYSRISSWHELSKPTKNEIKAIIKAYKIDDEDFIKECLYVEDFRQLRFRIESYLTLIIANRDLA